jgi:glucose/mannose-6-phosphate isomerase
MKILVENFSKQIAEAINIGKSFKPQTTNRKPQTILITGLGGSGIGGTIVSEIVSSECPVPVVVNKDYFIPSFVNDETLVIVSSYSGNTEETIQAMEAALKVKAKIVCVTSGGKIAEMAKQNNCDLIIIPGGSPPRAALAYSLTQLFFVLKNFGLIKTDFEKQLMDAVALFDAEENHIRKEAMEVAEFLFNKIPVLYAAEGYNGIATRFRQQLNENSKMLCWHHILPEMNHNELVGWAGGSSEMAVVILRNKTDYSRTQSRIEFSKKVFAKHTPHVQEIWSKGNSMLEQSIYLIHLTDWVSVFLAEKKGIDAVEVNIITQLKETLAKS